MFEQRNIKRLFLKTKKQTKDFLLSAKSREFFVFLCFFFIAAGFWLLQTLNNDYETEFSIPVRLRNVPENVVITSDPVSEVRVRVRDKGTVLLNYMLGKNFYPVILDFKNYINMGNHVQVQTSQVQKWITGQLNASTALLSMKPDTLEYYYSTGVSKMIPVKLCGNVSAGEQYYLPDTLFTPDSVRVYAPSDALDTMKVAYTLPLNLDNITDTLEREVTLSAPKGAKYIPASVKLTLPVDMYTEKTVEVPLRGVNFPADKVLRAFPSKIKISFQVGMGRFRQITADDFHLVVSYEELVRLGSEKYTVKLRTLPEGVSHVRFNPEQVDFLIEQIPADYGY
ncbi:ybbR family protein [Bacteroides sp. CAG:598]|nr:YbbR-like domain-containing protein [Caecibacteroides pullorum]MDC6281069.1 CdaR family protein [Caecibacteroides pullorum]CCX62931.1 ybbR family protein [Bacteroides sp. CAG:598]